MRSPLVRPAVAAERLAAGKAVLLDVREHSELEEASVKGALHIPMGEIARRVDELPREKPILVMCHHGMRSQQVANWLIKHGFTNVENVAGGIDAWADEVDSAVGKY
ncbi:MAG: rhodanese-like domain-containing protein [Candidatus Thermoplasmatota archaeon]